MSIQVLSETDDCLIRHTCTSGTVIEYIAHSHSASVWSHSASKTSDTTQYSVFVTIPSVIAPTCVQAISSHLRSMFDWKSEERMGAPIQRLQKWYHDDGSYFSPNWLTQTHDRWMSNPTESWIPELRGEIQNRLDRLFETELRQIPQLIPSCIFPNINSTLINYYRDGNDFIKFHTDDEKIFGNNPTIAMLAFGCERPLRFRPKSESDPSFSFSTKEGDVFVMLGCVQKQFTHGIVRDPDVYDSRFSITFREHRCWSNGCLFRM